MVSSAPVKLDFGRGEKFDAFRSYLPVVPRGSFLRKNQRIGRSLSQTPRSVIPRRDVAQISAGRASPSTRFSAEDNERACELRGLFHNAIPGRTLE